MINDLAPIQNDVDLLLSTYKEQEVPKTATQQLAQLYVFIAGKRFTDKGANLGFVIDYGDKVEVDIKSLLLSKIDGPIGKRIMWPYNTDDGKRLQSSENDADKLPWCGTNDGITPKGDYIGKKIIDWRTKAEVEIVANGCKTCPLGDDAKWAGLYDWDAKPILRPDFKGIQQHVNGAPPCAYTPMYVFFDHERNIPLTFVASNTTHRRQTLGRRKWRGNEAINGVPYYTDGTPPKVYNVETQRVTPMVLSIVKVDNKPYGFLPAPQFDLAPKALTEEEQIEFLNSVRLYHQDGWHDKITGARFNDYGGDDQPEAPSGDAPF